MLVKINRKIGEKSVQFEAECTGLKGYFKFFSEVADLPEACGNCGSKAITPKHHIFNNNDYYEVECNECKYRLRYGQRKVDGSLFTRGTWEEPYQKTGKVRPVEQPEDREEDLPF